MALKRSILLLTIGLASAVAQASYPVIHEIRGAATILTKSGFRGDATLKRGSRVEGGDQIKTDDKTTVVLRYPEGSLLVIGPKSEFEQTVAKEGEPLTVHLNSGKVRGLVVPALIKSKRLRFLVRTKAAVMGVRGTDFVMDAVPETQSGSIHLLSGTVDVAKNFEDLNAGKTVQIHENQWISASVSGGVGESRPFDRAEYLQKELGDLAGWESPRTTDSVLRFREQVVYIRQKSGGYLVSALTSWNPALPLSGDWLVSLSAGLMPLQGGTLERSGWGWSLTMNTEYRLVNFLWVEAGAGVQNWGDLAAAGLEARASLRYSNFRFWVIDGLIGTVAYYAPRLTPANPSFLGMFGVEIGL